MPKLIAMLRGINVSGQKLIKMADLRISLEKAGLQDVSTYVQSGNIIFNSEETEEAMVMWILVPSFSILSIFPSVSMIPVNMNFVFLNGPQRYKEKGKKISRAARLLDRALGHLLDCYAC